MKSINRLIGWVAILLLAPGAAMADEAATIRHMCELVKPSLVAVKYTWANELGSQELSAAGVIISSDGLVIIPIGIVTPAIVPDDQMHRFKIVVPSDTGDDTEIDATLQGRDERSNLAFVKADSPQKWKAIKFVDAPLQIGDPLYSVGILPKGAGYKTLVTTAFMSTRCAGRFRRFWLADNWPASAPSCSTPRGRRSGTFTPAALGKPCWTIRTIRTIFRW